MREFRNKIVAEFYEKNHRFPTIGFVPTMGALHQGHISLIKKVRAAKDCDRRRARTTTSSWPACSSTPSSSLLMRTSLRILARWRLTANSWRSFSYVGIICSPAGCDAVFAPTDEVMYPAVPKYLTYVTIEGSDSVSEGAARPGFFRGVATVVTKLFNIVQPTNAYFGQKDGLQAIMVQQFVRDLNIPVHITVCPIVRAVGALWRTDG